MYEDHFGFRTRPFRLPPDHELFFPSRQHRRALAHLEFGLHDGEGFILVSGEPGTGKSTVIAALLQSRLDATLSVLLIEDGLRGERSVLDALQARLGQAPAGDVDRASLSRNVVAQLRRVQSAGSRVVLLIDEAQSLDSSQLEELRLLSNSRGPRGPLLQVVLVGHTVLRDRIDAPELEQLRQRVVASIHLDSFDAAECEAYVRFRLTSVGWVDRPRIEDAAFQRLHQLTGGIPRLVNSLMDRTLLTCFIDELDEIGAGLLEDVARESGLERPPSTALANAGAGRTPPETEDELVRARDVLPLVSARLEAIDSRISDLDRRFHLHLSRLERRLTEAMTRRGGGERS